MTVDEPRFLTLDEVIYLRDDAIARFGGGDGIGDLGQIESALGAARNAFWYGHASLFEIAAAYAFHIAESQAFIDGNKRAGVASALVFLRLNGVRVPKDDGTVFDAMIGIAKKQLDKLGLANVIRNLAEKKQ